MPRSRRRAAPSWALTTTWSASPWASSTSTTCAPTSSKRWHERSRRLVAGDAVGEGLGGLRRRTAHASGVDDARAHGHPPALPAFDPRPILDHHRDGGVDPGDRAAVLAPARHRLARL